MLRPLIASMLATLLFVAVAAAEPLRVFVAGVKVSGAPNGEQLKASLPEILASRLTSETVLVVGDKKDAELEVSGIFTQLGGVFSIDLAARNSSGKVVARAFEQGEGESQVIQAVGAVARKLSAAVAGQASQAAPAEASRKASHQIPASRGVAAPAAIPASTVAPAPQTASSSDIVRTANIIAGTPVGKSIERVEGAMLGMAPGRKLPNGDREIFVVAKQSFGVYLFGDSGIRKLASESFPPDRQILAVDTADLDNDGTPEAYLTIMVGERVSSQAWEYRDAKLKKIADNLPYYFRTIRIAGGVEKVYVQEDSIDKEFYGDVMELVKNGSGYSARNPLKLPKNTNLYTFNQFRDRSGKPTFILFHPDGYLTVNDPDSGKELWRSADSLGGSETYFKKYSAEALRSGPVPYRTTFMQQRILVQEDGTIIVPRNYGGWQVGNSRSYSKNSVHCFAWNGSALVDAWHTKESQNYLADFFYDAAQKELVLLEVVQKENPIDKGASAILTKKVD